MNKLHRHLSFTILLCSALLSLNSFSQNGIIRFYEIDAGINKGVPNFSKFPDSGMGYQAVLSIGALHLDTSYSWASYYNYPRTGVSLSIKDHGNLEVLGRSLSFTPFIQMNTRDLRRGWSFRLAYGVSYYFSPYHNPENTENLVIGSGINWEFYMGLNRSIYTSDRLILNITASYLHSSNGHVKLPNYGLNSAALGLSCQFYETLIPSSDLPKFKTFGKSKKRNWFLTSRVGAGIQSLGSTSGPKDGPVKGVYTISAAAGVLFKDVVRFSGGLGYRFYHHYYDYIVDHETEGMHEQPGMYASNAYLFIGGEWQFRRMSAEIEGGLNLYKPFYEVFYENFESDEGLSKFLKSYFLSRMGLKIYARDLRRNPTANFYIAAHINANFGQADFTDVSFGFVHQLKEKK